MTNHIHSDPEIFERTPVFLGTRVPRLLRSDMPQAEM